MTNKINIDHEKDNYKKLVQVPIYENPKNLDEKVKPYYETPDYKNGNLIYTKTIIKNLKPHRTDEEINIINKLTKLKHDQTDSFENDAYKYYALSFYIEVKTSQEIKNIKIN